MSKKPSAKVSRMADASNEVDRALHQEERNRSGERMSPALRRMAELLGTDKADTLNFVTEVFLLSPRSTRLNDIAKAVSAHLESDAGPPSPHHIAARLSTTSSPVSTSVPTGARVAEKPAKKERKHVSMWTIRR